MIPCLYMHTNQVMLPRVYPIDDPWRYNIRVQIFCASQEEKDYLLGLNLMHGREIEIHQWDEWLKSETVFMSMTDSGIQICKQRPKVLPIAYTTFHIDLQGY